MSPDISAAAQFGWIARARAIGTKMGHLGNAANWAAANGAPSRVVELIKAPIGAGSTTDSNLGTYGISIGQWTDSAKNRSVFYRLLSDGAFVRMPMYVAVGITVATTSGYLVGEGAATPVGKVRLSNIQLQPKKAQALIIFTNELLNDVSAPGQQLFNRELLSAVSDAVDEAFLTPLIDTGSPAIASTSPLADVRAALLQINSVGTPRLYWVASPDVGKLGSTLSTNAPAFAAVSAGGGELCNLPLLISSGLAAGTLALIDGSGLAADGLTPTVDVSSQADIKMDSDPSSMNATTPSGTTMVSMFQNNSVALRATAVFACEKLRDDAVAVVTGINATSWGIA